MKVHNTNSSSSGLKPPSFKFLTLVKIDLVG